MSNLDQLFFGTSTILGNDCLVRLDVENLANDSFLAPTSAPDVSAVGRTPAVAIRASRTNPVLVNCGHFLTESSGYSVTADEHPHLPLPRIVERAALDADRSLAEGNSSIID